ncbi:ATP-binding protein [Pseudomonas schmalbachii]|uniref:histidine kinase n=1 Tax=Pseudomonas schmalbachii TaxID=2816993 RepID=A0ABS3TK98_9PSED|nr:ATP-binding protein [Pseudomonas schmalbachii]MBO3274056.1 response regulator [Pseudomonas schmalbachii]
MSTVMIVDEQPVTRHALRLLMDAEGHAVVAEVGNGTEALALARQRRPDLMIVELSVPGLGGLDIIQRLSKQAPDVKVLVLTAQSPEYFAARCLEAGAAGFVSKQDDLRQLSLAVRALLNGNTYFPRDITHPVSGIEGEAGALKELSGRELTVLQMLAQGMGNTAIGAQLLLSEKTVATYKSRMMHKLHAHSPLELIDIARRNGLVKPVGGTEESHASPMLDEVQQHELELLHNVIDAMPGTVAVRDTEGRMVMCNRQYLEEFDVRLEDVIGRKIHETDVFDGENTRFFHDGMVAAIKRGEPYCEDVVFNIKGSRRLLRHWGQPYRDSSGEVVGLICGNLDITDQDMALLDLQKLNRSLEEASREKLAFLSSVTAEMSGPLNSIAAMLELARNQADRQKQDEVLAVADAAAKSLQKTLDDFRSFLRLEAGSHPLNPESLNIETLLREKVADYAAIAEGKGLQLELNTLGARHPDVWVDRDAFRRIAESLLANALKFTDVGKVLVELKAGGRGKGLTEVVLSVRDSGIGIPLAEQKQVFELFRQGTDSQRIRRGGSGTGLAICKRLVDLLGGSMELESSPGEGTCMTVRLMLPAVR